MSDTIRSFFARHSAVPANDRGPQWSQATDEVLLDWYGDYASAVGCGWNRRANRDATPAEREAMRPLYEELVAHLTTRANRPGASPAIVAAHLRAYHHRQGSLR